MPALIKAGTSNLATSLNAPSTTLVSGATSTVLWHSQTVASQSWQPSLALRWMSIPMPAPSDNSTNPSPVASANTSAVTSNQPSAHPSGQKSEVSPQPSYAAARLFPQISVQDTANMLFDQLTDLIKLLEAWTSSQVGSTGSATVALKIARDTALLVAYQSGGLVAHPKHCGASLVDVSSCVVRNLVKAEEALQKDSSNRITDLMKKLETHQRDLLGFLGSASGSTNGAPAPVSAATIISSATTWSSGMVTGQSAAASRSPSAIAGLPVSTGAGSSPAGVQNTSGSLVSTNLASANSGIPSRPANGTESSATYASSATTPTSLPASATDATKQHSWTASAQPTSGQPNRSDNSTATSSPTSAEVSPAASSPLPAIVEAPPAGSKHRRDAAPHYYESSHNDGEWYHNGGHDEDRWHHKDDHHDSHYHGEWHDDDWPHGGWQSDGPHHDWPHHDKPYHDGRYGNEKPHTASTMTSSGPSGTSGIATVTSARPFTSGASTNIRSGAVGSATSAGSFMTSGATSGAASAGPSGNANVSEPANPSAAPSGAASGTSFDASKGMPSGTSTWMATSGPAASADSPKAMANASGASGTSGAAKNTYTKATPTNG